MCGRLERISNTNVDRKAEEKRLSRGKVVK